MPQLVEWNDAESEFELRRSERWGQSAESLVLKGTLFSFMVASKEELRVSKFQSTHNDLSYVVERRYEYTQQQK